MLTFWGSRRRFCDGISRRNFLQIGAFGTGLTLADMLRLKAGQATAGSCKGGTKEAVITFPEPFSTVPHVMITPVSENYRPPYPDVFAVTVKYRDKTSVKVNIIRIDAMNFSWDQQLRLDWIAWE